MNDINDTQYLSITVKKPENSDGKVYRGSGDVLVALSNGDNLGLVQSFTVNASVGNFPTATVTTFLNDLDVKILEENTKLIIDDYRPKSCLYKLEESLLKLIKDYLSTKDGIFLPHIKNIYDFLVNNFKDYGQLLYDYLQNEHTHNKDIIYAFALRDLYKYLEIKIAPVSILNNYKGLEDKISNAVNETLKRESRPGGILSEKFIKR